jgi:hypothetical protein
MGTGRGREGVSHSWESTRRVSDGPGGETEKGNSPWSVPCVNEREDPLRGGRRVIWYIASLEIDRRGRGECEGSSSSKLRAAGRRHRRSLDYADDRQGSAGGADVADSILPKAAVYLLWR